MAVLKKGESFKDAVFFTKILQFGEIPESVGKKNKRLIVIMGSGYFKREALGWNGRNLKLVRVVNYNLDALLTYSPPKQESWVQFKTQTDVVGWANLGSISGSSDSLDYDWDKRNSCLAETP